MFSLVFFTKFAGFPVFFRFLRSCKLLGNKAIISVWRIVAVEWRCCVRDDAVFVGAIRKVLRNGGIDGIERGKTRRG